MFVNYAKLPRLVAGPVHGNLESIGCLDNGLNISCGVVDFSLLPSPVVSSDLESTSTASDLEIPTFFICLRFCLPQNKQQNAKQQRYVWTGKSVCADL